MRDEQAYRGFWVWGCAISALMAVRGVALTGAPGWYELVWCVTRCDTDRENMSQRVRGRHLSLRPMTMSTVLPISDAPTCPMILMWAALRS